MTQICPLQNLRFCSRQLAQVQEAAVKQHQQPAMPTTTQSAASEAESVDPQEAAAFLENLKKLTEKAGKVAQSSTAEDFAATMEEFQQEGFGNDIMPFMHGLMSSLLSKEMMYPSLKEMCEKVRAPYL